MTKVLSEDEVQKRIKRANFSTTILESRAAQFDTKSFKLLSTEGKVAAIVNNLYDKEFFAKAKLDVLVLAYSHEMLRKRVKELEEMVGSSNGAGPDCNAVAAASQ